jgi:hypothetical protein
MALVRNDRRQDVRDVLTFIDWLLGSLIQGVLHFPVSCAPKVDKRGSSLGRPDPFAS